MIAGDVDSVTRMTDDAAMNDALMLVARFAEADLARWFNRFRSLGAPNGSVSGGPGRGRSGYEEVHYRYVVGRVALPDNAVQDFPIMTVSVAKIHGSWMVIASKPNARLFDDGTGEVAPEEDLTLDFPAEAEGNLR